MLESLHRIHAVKTAVRTSNELTYDITDDRCVNRGTERRRATSSAAQCARHVRLTMPSFATHEPSHNWCPSVADSTSALERWAFILKTVNQS